MGVGGFDTSESVPYLKIPGDAPARYKGPAGPADAYLEICFL